MMDTFFPNPVEHAAAILEVCGSLESARNAAECNCDFAANDEESLYWFAVLNALTPEDACQAN